LILAILLIIEAVFIAESFTSLLENVVRYGGSVLDVMNMLALKMPKIIEFGLPLAVLFGIFFATSNTREGRELIVCAAAGAPWQRIPLFAVLVGTAGFFISLTISGFVAPMAAYAERLSLAEMKSLQIVREIENPGSGRKIRSLAGRTFISSTEDKPNGKGKYLFIHHPTTGRDWHVSQAGNWDIKGPLGNGTYAIFMKAFTDYKGYQQPKTATESKDDQNFPPRFTSMDVEKVVLGFRLDNLAKATNRNKRNNELSLIALGQRFGGDLEGETRRQVGEMLARALLNPAAALLDIATLALSAGVLGRYLALPFATIAVLLFDMAGRMLMGQAAVSGFYVLVFSGIIALAFFTIPSLIYIMRFGEKLIAPVSGRT
jgi:lipopolysaccharide export LptBFGC system permease protein LptF